MKLASPRKRFLWLGLLLLAWLASPFPSRATRTEEDLRRVEGKIRKERKTVRALSTRKAGVLERIEAIDRKVASAEARLRRCRARKKQLQEELEKVEQESERLDRQIRRREAAEAKRLVAYYRLGRKGVLPVVFSSAPLAEKFRNMDTLRRILLADRESLLAFRDLVRRREEARRTLRARLEEERALEGEIRRKVEALKRDRREKRRLVARIEHDEDLHKELLEELRRAARDLEKKVLQERPRPVPAAGGSLAAEKGRLPWPVEGRLYRAFRSPRDAGAGRPMFRCQGIDIKTTPGLPVRAVWEGGVVYADWFRGYGKLLIIQHDEKDYTILAHLGEITKRKGERVESGEIVGRTGETGTTEGCLVHFEIWHKGRPRDPLQWLRKRGRVGRRRR